ENSSGFERPCVSVGKHVPGSRHDDRLLSARCVPSRMLSSLGLGSRLSLHHDYPTALPQTAARLLHSQRYNNQPEGRVCLIASMLCSSSCAGCSARGAADG